MLRTAAVFLLLLLAPLLFAQSADIEVAITGPGAVPPGAAFTAVGTVTNKGPNAAVRVSVHMYIDAQNTCVNSADIGTLAPGETRRFECTGAMPQGTLVYRAIANIGARSSTQDIVETNNFASHTVRAITPPDLFIFENRAPVDAPGLPFPIEFQYGNRAEFPATGVTITITSPAGFGRVPSFCTVEGIRARCVVGDLAPLSQSVPILTPKVLSLEVIAPDESAATYEIRAQIDGNEEDAAPLDDTWIRRAQTYRTFFVTSTADNGSGTLRSAIENANAACGDTIPCLIAFRIAPAAQAWHTIAVTSPLPRIRPQRGVFIDGTTQTRYFGDSNPHGPEIEINGEAAGETNGLDFEAGCVARITGLTINGFAGSAIVLAPGEPCQLGQRVIEQNYLGTDPTGTRAIPNHRGIWIAMPNVFVRVTDNIISGNVRAGVFVASGIAGITRNRIGLTRELQPLGNGASGIYFSNEASNSDATDNYIGFNAHFGIAIAPDAENVSAARNSVQANAQHGIDWGLDGVITNTPVALPVITSARFENGYTIIDGTSSVSGTFPVISVYANDAPDPSGYGEGQYVLGEVHVDAYGPHHPFRFRFVWPGDLRGKWVTATATRRIYLGFAREGPAANANTGAHLTTTSEFSRAFEVK